MTIGDLGYVKAVMAERDRDGRDRRLERAARPLPCCDEGRLAFLRRHAVARPAATCAC